MIGGPASKGFVGGPTSMVTRGLVSPDTGATPAVVVASEPTGQRVVRGPSTNVTYNR